MGIIEPCDENEDGFYSNLFTVPKRDDSVCVIFNLKDLNWFIDTDHFKMDTVKQAIDLMMNFVTLRQLIFLMHTTVLV